MMNNDDNNWTDVADFFASNIWDDICDDAIKHDHPPSTELMDDVLMRFKSAIFYATKNNLTRFNKEIADLAIITRHLTQTL